MPHCMYYLFSALARRIVRNKAAEKAKHVHQQQTAAAANSSSPQQPAGGVSVITHAPSTQHDRYSINGILGIPHHPSQDPNGNNIKRKRDLDLHHHSGKSPLTHFDTV